MGSSATNAGRSAAIQKATRVYYGAVSFDVAAKQIRQEIDLCLERLYIRPPVPPVFDLQLTV